MPELCVYLIDNVTQRKFESLAAFVKASCDGVSSKSKSEYLCKSFTAMNDRMKTTIPIPRMAPCKHTVAF